MNNSAYLSLIDDTLSYLKGLLPQEEARPLPRPKKEAPKPPPPTPKKEILKTTAPPPTFVKSEEKKHDDPSIKLETPSTPTKEPTETLRKILFGIDPELYLHDKPPSDARVKRIKEAWKEKRDTPTITILFQGRAYRPFVMNIAKAIDITFATCRIVEVETGKKWDLFLDSPNLKFIIAPDHLIFSTKELLSFYKENPQEKVRYLGKIPLLLLPDLSLYYKDPYLKRSLWNVITQNLQPLF